MMGIKMIFAKEAKREHYQLKSHWSAETQLSQKILIAILAHLEEQNVLLKKLLQVKLQQAKKPKKRKQTEYQKFFGQKIKEGLTATEVARLWQKE